MSASDCVCQAACKDGRTRTEPTGWLGKEGGGSSALYPLFYRLNTGVREGFDKSKIKKYIKCPCPPFPTIPCRQAAAPPGCRGMDRCARESRPCRNPPRTLPFKSSGPECPPAAPPRSLPSTPTLRYMLLPACECMGVLLPDPCCCLLGACAAVLQSAHANLTPAEQ